MSPTNKLGTRRSRKSQLSTSSHRTATSKFMELPVELIRMILRLIYPIPEPADLDSDYLYRKRPYLAKIVALSSVCRLWRDIVIKDPTLWSFVKLPSKQALIRMSILRSGQVPLVVDIGDLGWEFETPKTKVDLVFEEYHRFKMLGITLGDRSFWEAARPAMTRPAPVLEVLCLRTSRDAVGLNSLLEGGAPQLKKLCIRGASIPILSLTSLRVLDLSIVNITKSYDNLLKLLMSNTQLESLSLDLSFFSDSIPLNSIEKRMIHLPSLKELYLHAAQHRIPHVLQGLVFPSNISWLFKIYECNTTAVIDQIDAIVSQTPLIGLEVVVDSDRFKFSVAQLHSRESSVFCYSPRADCRPPLILRNAVLSQFNLSSVTTFTLKFRNQYDIRFTRKEKESIKDVFRFLISLHKLTVAYRSYELTEQFEYLDSLMRPVGSHGSILPCPLLTELTIIGLNASSISYGSQLKRCILVRSDANCPFSKIRLLHCMATNLEVRTLLEGLVEWEEIAGQGPTK